MGVRSVPVVIADLVQRAELTPLKGRGPEVVHDPHTSSLSESTNPNGAALFSTPVSNPAQRPGVLQQHSSPPRTLSDQGQPSGASGNLCPVDDFAESAVVGVAVPPGDVAADHAGLVVVAGVVGAVQGEVAQRLELGLDPVQPRRIGRGVGQLDVVGCRPPATRGSSVVDRCGLKLSSTIPMRTSGGYKVRRYRRNTRNSPRRLRGLIWPYSRSRLRS